MLNETGSDDVGGQIKQRILEFIAFIEHCLLSSFFQQASMGPFESRMNRLFCSGSFIISQQFNCNFDTRFIGQLIFLKSMKMSSAMNIMKLIGWTTIFSGVFEFKVMSKFRTISAMAVFTTG